MRVCGLLLMIAALAAAEEVYRYRVAEDRSILWVTLPADRLYFMRWLEPPKQFFRKGAAGKPLPTEIGTKGQSKRPTVPGVPASGSVRASTKPASLLSQ